jgi:FkbM family methyltransferase
MMSSDPPPYTPENSFASTEFDEIWIDVGAHLGEKTFAPAQANHRLRVYAFEPLSEMAARIMNQLPNYIVFQQAVCETDGSATFYV